MGSGVCLGFSLHAYTSRINVYYGVSSNASINIFNYSSYDRTINKRI